MFPNTNLTTSASPATQMSIITDIQCPGAEGNAVYCTDGYDIFKSTNGGVTWSADTNLFNNLGINQIGDYVVSISIGDSGTNADVFAGTSTFGRGGGGAFVLQESVFNNPWANLNVGIDRPFTATAPNKPISSLDVTKVQVDRNFGTTQMVVAGVSDYTNGVTRVTCKYGGLESGIPLPAMCC